MLTIQSFITNPIEENCYVVSDETKQACIIDCGCFSEESWDNIKQYITKQKLTPVKLLHTHSHFDHVMGDVMVLRDYHLLPELETLQHGGVIRFGNSTFTVIATPGHTQDGVCFYSKADDVVFVGDTLFYGSVGRTDLPGGNVGQLISMINNRLMTLPEKTIVYCGHGEKTTIGREKRFNPFL